MIGNLGIGLVGRAINQVQVKRVHILAHQDALLCQRDSRRRRITDIGDEYSLPDGCALRALYVLYVEHQLRKTFVKHAWLDLKRGLRTLQPILQPPKCRLRLRGQVHTVNQGQQPCHHRKDGNDSKEGPHPDAAGAHGGDFAVGSQPAKAD